MLKVLIVISCDCSVAQRDGVCIHMTDVQNAFSTSLETEVPERKAILPDEIEFGVIPIAQHPGLKNLLATI